MMWFLTIFFGVGILLALLVSSSSSQTIVLNWRAVDGQDVMVKLVLAACLAWFLPTRRNRVNYWSLNFLVGLLVGSVGLFFLKAVHISGVTRWPFDVFALAIPETGSVFMHPSQVNPLFASCLVPIVLMAALVSHAQLKWLALGISVGMVSYLVAATFSTTSVVWLGQGLWVQGYLFLNAVVGAIATRMFFNVATE